MAAEQSNTVVAYLHRLVQRSSDSNPTDGELLTQFILHQDEQAVSTLVQRYGPLVLGVCRRVLRNHQDAEDAFQATFLVLLHKARSIADPELLANWLYGVAYYTARNARVGATRRQAREREVAQMPRAEKSRDEDLRELRSVLDEELNRLPETYRMPIILCELQGMSRKEVARLLGCLEGTLSSRLARARQRLQVRLTQRGLTLCAGGLAVALSRDMVAGAVAAPLMNSTVRLALSVGIASSTTAAPVPARVAALADSVLKTMFLAKLRIATGILLGIGIFALGGTLSLQALSARQTETPQESPSNAAQPRQKRIAQATQSDDAQDCITYSGRVLAPDGKPVPDAKLYMTLAWGYPHRPSPSPEYASAGPNGRFTFRVPKREFGDRITVVAAAAANYGVAWVQVGALETPNDLTLRLLKDDAPITGQIVDLEGKAVAGATLRLLQINAAPGGDLGPWVEGIKGTKGLNYLLLEQRYLSRHTIAVPMQVTTDVAGRFRLNGIGGNRLVRAQLDGLTIASQHLCILTRPGDAFEVTIFEGQPEFHIPRVNTTYYGANFRLAAAPTKPVVGVVRDRDTKKPLAGVTVQSRNLGMVQFDLAQTTTDAEGRYRLTGLPKAEDCSITVIPGKDQPYGCVGKKVPTSPGLDAVTVDFELKRGIWIEGKIRDRVTGKPVKTEVVYSPVDGNPNLRDYSEFVSGISTDDRPSGGKEPGSYRVLGIPGPGLISVEPPNDHYLLAGEREDDFGTNGIKEPLVNGGPPASEPAVSRFSALARVNPVSGIDSVKQDITLDPGWRINGRILGPDDKPLAGAEIVYINDRNVLFSSEQLKTDEFEAWFNPQRPRDVLLLHQEKGLVGVAHPPIVKNGSVTVRMEQGDLITGRLLDPHGKAQAVVDLRVSIRRPNEQGWSKPIYMVTTDAQGGFRLAPLLAGYEYNLTNGNLDLILGERLRSGETQNLGDVRLK